MAERTQAAGIFNEILEESGVLQVIESSEGSQDGYLLFNCKCRLAPGYRELHYVNNIVVPLIEYAWRAGQRFIATPQKQWTTKMVNNIPKVAYAYVIEVALQEAVADPVLRDLYQVLVEPAQAQQTQPTVPTNPRGAVDNPLPMTDADRQRTMISLPDEVIIRPLPGAFVADRNRPKPVPSVDPGLSGREFVSSAGATGFRPPKGWR